MRINCDQLFTGIDNTIIVPIYVTICEISIMTINHQTGKSTDLVYADYAFDTGLDDADFVADGGN